ncbi:MAG: radical SAM protein [Chlorobi bacterium]|nr:radical SAM protein [Chlorobiota bacterium]
MKNHKKYILNPDYLLRSDIKRVFLVSTEILRGPQFIEKSTDSAHFTIHPFYAIILSSFDGNTLEETINKVVYNLDINKDLVTSFVSKLIENESTIEYVLNSETYYLPPYTIVEYQEYMPIKKYKISDFAIQEIDITSPRYYLPLDLTLMLNNVCVTDCIYCYVDKRKLYQTSIPFERIKELIKEARSLNMRSFEVIGGEFFLYKYWRELLYELTINNFNPFISTKIPINEDDIKTLKEVGINDLQISLDSMIEGNLVKILKVNKSYINRMKQTFDNLEKYNIKVRVHTILTNKNKDIKDIKSIIQFLSKYTNIVDLRIDNANYSMYKNNFEDIRISISDIESIVKYLNNIKKENNLSFKISNPEIHPFHKIPEMTTEQKYNNFKTRSACSGNLSAFFILPDGKVTICEEIYWHPTFILGDVKSQNIEEIWQSKKAVELFNIEKNKISSESICYSCEEFTQCHDYLHVCWKDVIATYGEEKWDYPDPACPKAPSINEKMFLPYK